MIQSKKYSLIESIINVTVGYVLVIASQLVIFPIFDIHKPLRDNLLMGLCFMGISLARNYIIRRLFERKLNKV